MVAGNPFPKVPAARVGIRVQRTALDAEAEADLARSLSIGDRIKVVEGDLWMAFVGAPNQSRLLGALTKKRRRVGRSRGLGTVTRIDGLLAADQPD